MNSKVIFFSLIIVFLIYNLASFILRQRKLIKLNVNSLLKSLDFVPPTTKELQYEEGVTRTTRARTTSTRFVSAHLPSVFCIIKTNPRSLASNKTLAVYKTWARKCNNYRFISLLETNSSLEKEEEIELREPFYILKPAGRYPENHDNMTEKVYAGLKSIFMRFPDYDWYYLSDDDVYANIYNMKLFLRDKDLHKPVTYGFDFRKVVKGGYHSGGPGYILSREAFSRLGINLMQNRTQCPITGIDDVDIQSCLRELEVYPAPSLDHLKRERFIPLGLIAHFTGSVPQWFFEFSSNTFKKGYSCCSDRLIAVHYLKPEEIVRLDIAFETQTNVVLLYDKNANLRRHITFKDVFKMYILLGDFEMNTTSFKINFDDEDTNKDSV